MLHLLGIDAGGTSTRAMLLTGDGTCLGIGRGGRGNPVSDGVEPAAAAIGTAVAGALSFAPEVQPAAITAVTLAMAGGSIGGPDAPWLRPTLDDLGVRAPSRIEPDLLAMFASGTHEPDGYGLVAGTGSTAVRVRGGEVDLTADGLGWLLGDKGSGFWIGHQIARAVAAHLDGRGPATSLTPAVLLALGVTETAEIDRNGRTASLGHLVTAVYGASPLRLASLAPLAFADTADAVSTEIVAEAEAALAELVLDVAVPELTGPLVVGGGVATQPRVREAVVGTVRARGVTGPVHRVDDGLVGAGVIALRRAGILVDAEIFTRLAETTASRRG
ncbi:N-acetylglucosamine kinase [Pseudactinotalea terrae]|uniref:N-acetylglucosamine kinase n=1 Tax=Pseudactinotalea terrae TaxID=1743262 RepID=UPI001390998C|nr:BadF/BadG/BcrA/BcrD ATPase family protein [Pseudactinotalea terrae]